MNDVSDESHALPDHSEDRYAGLPESWSLSSRELYAAVSEADPDLSPAQLAILYESARLVAAADALDELVESEGLMTTGYNGQPVLHPPSPKREPPEFRPCQPSTAWEAARPRGAPVPREWRSTALVGAFAG